MTTTTQDVEMKDNNQTPAQSIVSATHLNSPAVFKIDCPFSPTDLKEIAALIDTGSYTKEVRRVARAVRLTVGIRQKLTASVVASFLDFALGSGSEAHARLSSFVPKSDEHDMEVDTASSTSLAASKHKKYNEAKACSSASIARLKSLNKRTIDVIASRFTLLSLHHSATLRHDEWVRKHSSESLARNYLHYNLYDQAEKLRSKAPRFEAHSNQQ
ncbi:hypothetical protein HID58_027875, partial [Brassica napus]